jgi:hypothetical protein
VTRTVSNSDEEQDKTYNPKRKPVSEEDSLSSSDGPTASPAKQNKPHKKRGWGRRHIIFRVRVINQQIQTKVTGATDDRESDVSIKEVEGPKKGRNPVKAKWAFELWTPRLGLNKDAPVWK